MREHFDQMVKRFDLYRVLDALGQSWQNERRTETRMAYCLALCDVAAVAIQE